MRPYSLNLFLTYWLDVVLFNKNSDIFIKQFVVSQLKIVLLGVF